MSNSTDNEILEFLSALEATERGGEFTNPYAQKRGSFSGAQFSGTAEGWNPSEYSPNQNWQIDGATLRRRAWDLFLNNPFAASVIGSYVANVIECGILPDRESSGWNKAFRRWAGLDAHCSRECDYSRDQTITEMEHLWLTEVLVGGGCLSNFVYLDRKSQRVPVAVELIGEDRFSESLTHYGANSKTRNAVVNGLEIEQPSGRTIAYHIQPPSLENFEVDHAADPVRIPAQNVEYGYLKRHSREKRGTTIFRSVIIWLHAMGYYVDNELFASNLKSAWAFVLKKDPKVALADENFNESLGLHVAGTSDTTETVQRMTRGMVYETTGAGGIEAVGPNVPHESSIPWLQLINHAISVGVGLSYSEVFRDYKDETLGTLRVAQNRDQKRYAPLQKFAICHFGNPVVKRFDAEAVFSGLPGFPTPAEYAETIDSTLEDQEWMVPGWASPNPKEDAQADKLNLENVTDSRKSIVARKTGRPVREVFREREEEARAIEEAELESNEQSEKPLQFDDGTSSGGNE